MRAIDADPDASPDKAVRAAKILVDEGVCRPPKLFIQAVRSHPAKAGQDLTEHRIFPSLRQVLRPACPDV